MSWISTSVLAIPLSLAIPGIAHADSCTDAAAVPLPLESGVCADVLRQEARWLTAISAGDRAAVETILSPQFAHTTAEGQYLDRAQELAGIVEAPFTMNPSEQQVVVSGDTAVVHGVNTVIGDDGTVMARERFTDVFVLQGGQWIALAAQETSLGE
jgi:ketosteroid isomerase-like protein